MNKKVAVVAAIVASFVVGFLINRIGTPGENDSISEIKSDITGVETIEPVKEINNNMEESKMKLGAFSMSLSVKDLKVSKAFYENLGFTTNGGSMEMNYLIMKNENALIGLFQGMFEGNILTFNPGWNENAENIESFDDVRTIQASIKENGINLMTEVPDTSASGPASLMLTDPDGNLILIDQHR